MKEAKSMENSEWKEVKLRDITTKLGSGATPRGGSNTYKDEGISLIRSQNVLDLKFSKNGLVLIDEEQAHNLKNVIIEEQDILLNITGDSVARACMVPNKILPARVNQHVSIIRADRDIVHPKYILYNLISQKEELLLQSEIGATRKAITKGMLEKLELIIPPLPEQTAIASILSSLDDKIDLLHRQNTTLEKMAETLFRQWFVEEAKEEWEVDTLGKLFDIGIGRTPPRKEHHWFSENPLDIKWVSIKDMGSSGIYISRVSEYLTQEAVDKFSIPIIPENTVMLSFKMTIGRIVISTEKMLSNEAIAHFKLKDNSKLYSEFLYLYLKTYQWEQLGSTSSIVEAINSQMIKEMEIVVPDEQKIRDFRKLTMSYFEKIKSNQTQIRTLTTLRDTLLPKLMSGEIRLNTI